MRDVILVRKGGPVKIKVSEPIGGHFKTLFTPTVAGIEVPVTRGWTAIDATARRGKGKKRRRVKFEVVNTHFEAFDDETQRPSIRALQAHELISGPTGPYGEGPAFGNKVIVVGDLNSDSPGSSPVTSRRSRRCSPAAFAISARPTR